MRPVRVKGLTLPGVLAAIALGLVLGSWLVREARLVGGLPVRAVLVTLVVVAIVDLVLSLAVVNFGRLTRRE
jgi:hypothetical protein